MVEANSGKWLVIALFETRVAGVVTARTLAEEARSKGREGHIGVLSLNDAGEPVVTNLEDRSAEDAPEIGVVLGVIAGALREGVMPARHDFFDTHSELTTDDIARIGAELEAGQAVVAVLERRKRAEGIVVRLTGFGGRTEIHHLTARVLRQAADEPWIAS